jgi:hypothetical protein
MVAIRFRLRSMLLVVAVVAVIIVAFVRLTDVLSTLDLTKGHQATCKVHKLRMSPAQVNLTYGMRYDTPMDTARPTLFPHADEPYDTRACIGMQQTKARVYVCPACTKARSTWLQTNGKP